MRYLHVPMQSPCLSSGPVDLADQLPGLRFNPVCLKKSGKHPDSHT